MPIHAVNLTLRLFTADDYQQLRELDSDPRVLQYRTRKTITPEMTGAFLAGVQTAHLKVPRTNYAYAIILREPGTWLGQCGLTMIPTPDSNERRAYLWFSLLPAYWGQGYMTEAVQTLVYVGFHAFKLTVIDGECAPENVASAKVLAKAGLVFDGKIERADKSGRMITLLHSENNHVEWRLKGLAEPETVGSF